MKVITSKDNPLIKDLLSLTQKKTRTLEGKFLVEGFHLVEVARQMNCLEMVLTTTELDIDIEQVLINNSVLDKMTQTQNPEGVVGVCKITEQTPFELRNDRLVLILDGISDPGNMGTLIRTAAAFGFDSVISSPDSVDYYNDKVVRSSQGAVFQIPLYSMNLELIYDLLRENDFQLLASSLKGTPLSLCKFSEKPIGIIVGNETHGISTLSESRATQIIKIPMQASVDSLNAGVAGGILMYYLSQK